MERKYKFYTRWNKDILRCACLYGNEACDRYKTCEIEEFTHNQYEGIKECMKERSYKRSGGAIKQKG